MKKGFKIYLQRDLTPEDRAVCINWINTRFIGPTASDADFRYFGTKGGGYTSGIWRGRLGILIDDGVSKNIRFRRISKSRRKFACVYEDTMVVKDDKLLDKSHGDYRDVVEDGPIPKMCRCPRHSGSLKVDWAQKPEFDLYALVWDWRD